MNTELKKMLSNLMTINGIWITIGLLGQLMFSMRFVIQWLVSEKHKKSIIPEAFWYFSLAGGIILFSYAVHIKDPVFILGQSIGIFIYLRNIYFIKKQKVTA